MKPAPVEAKLCRPGSRRSKASSSAKSDTPSEGGTISTCGTRAMKDTGSMSRTGSYRSEGNSAGAIDCVLPVVSSRVWPSVARATASAATVPPAPVRFSTTTFCPSAACKPGASSRAVMSVTPPGAKGLTMRSVARGQSGACANAGEASDTPSSARRRTLTARRPASRAARAR